MSYTSLHLYLRPEINVPVLGASGEVVREIPLPEIFRFPVRKDIIKRVYLSEFTAKLQPKGRDPMAGKRTSARSYGVGLGLARVPRIRGTGRGALVNMTRGGRLAHPPRVEKRIHEEVNRKERIIGIVSALSATAIPEMVRDRGHRFSAKALPVVIADEVVQSVSKTKEAKELLNAIGIYEDVARVRERTRNRAGKGKMRGRRLKKPVGPLFVLESREAPLALSIQNLPGVEVVEPLILSVIHLAPGGVPGRLAVFQESTLHMLNERLKVAVP